MVAAFLTKDSKIVLQVGTKRLELIGASLTVAPEVVNRVVFGVDRDDASVYHVSQSRRMTPSGAYDFDNSDYSAQELVEQVGVGATVLQELPAGTGATATDKAWRFAPVLLESGTLDAPYDDLITLGGTWGQSNTWRHGQRIGGQVVSASSTMSNYTVPANTPTGSLFVVDVEDVSSTVITDSTDSGYAGGIKLVHNPSGGSAVTVNKVPGKQIFAAAVGSGDTVRIEFTQASPRSITISYGLVS